MSSRSITSCIVLFALYTSGTVFAAPASANWLINESNLAEGSKASFATTESVDKSILMKIAASTTVKISCKGSTLHDEAFEIIGLDEGQAKLLKFESCETTEPATGCVLEGQPTSITTEPINLYVTSGTTSPEGRITILPQKSATLATIPFSAANTCSFKGHAAVLGGVVVGAATLQNEAATQGVEGLGSAENSEPLLVNENSTYIEGGPLLLKLASGEKFSNRAIFAVDVSPNVARNRSVKFMIENISGQAATPMSIQNSGNVNGFTFTAADLTRCAGPYTAAGAGSMCEVTVSFAANGTVGSVAALGVRDANGKLNGSATVGVLK